MNEEKKKKLKDILKKISSPEEMAEFESDKTSKKLDIIASAFGAISAMKGKDGEDGTTPTKGKDYFTKPEIEWFIKKTTPLKGKDYFDGNDGYSPIKGKDYFDGVNGYDGETPKHRWVKTLLQFANPDETWGELVDLKGEKGEVGAIPKHEWKGTKLRFETVEGKWGELVDLKGKDGTSKGVSPGGWIGGGISKFTQLSDAPSGYVGQSGKFVKVKSTEDGLEFATGGGGGTVATVVAGNNIDVDATDPANPIVSVETLALADISDITASATEVNYTDGVTSAIQTQLNAKQATLVSGTNIKTINSTSLLGAGDIVIAGGSGISRAIVSSSGSFTAGATAATDYVYLITGAHAVALPTAVSNTNRYTFKNNHSAAITITPNGAETLEGAASIQIAPEDAVDIISNNSNWFII